MSDLAYNINGEGFELPETATGWRVRRMKPRGAPEVVYGRDGLPLIIAIESDLDELRRNVDAAGRFRLDAVDDRGRTIEGVQAAYVVVSHRNDAAPVPVVAETAVAPRAPVTGTDGVVAEAMRLNTELAKSVIDRFPEMMQAAALLLRAADGAGLPAREPRPGAEDDAFDEDEPTAPKAGFDISAFVAQVIPMLVMGLGNGKAPALDQILDWRKAAPVRTAKAAKSPRPDGPGDAPADTDPHVPENATDVLPPIDPQTMAHFVAVQSALTPDEAAIAREVAKELSAAELRAWFDELSKLSVPDAVAKVRKLISGFGKEGGAS